MKQPGIGEWASRALPDTRTPTAFTLAGMLVAAMMWAGEADLVHPRELGVALAFAVEAALLLALVGLLHAWRPRGPDVPPRAWTETWRRVIGPMPFAVVGLVWAGGCTWGWVTKGEADLLLLAGLGAALALVGLIAAIHRARRPS